MRFLDRPEVSSAPQPRSPPPLVMGDETMLVATGLQSLASTPAQVKQHRVPDTYVLGRIPR